jgi:tetratricopeptide (TPR) repeat protein
MDMNSKKVFLALCALGLMVLGAWTQDERLSAAKHRLEEREREYGRNSEAVAVSLQYIGSIYASNGRFDDAEAAYREALAFWEKFNGPDHGRLWGVLEEMAEMYVMQGRMDLAEPLFKRVEGIWRQKQEPWWIVMHLNEKGRYYAVLQQYEHAFNRYSRALAIGEELLGPDHFRLADTHEGLAWAFRSGKKDFRQAEIHYQRALAIKEKNLGKDHVEVAKLLEEMGDYYRIYSDRMVEAKACYLRSLDIWGKPFAPGEKEIAVLWRLLAETDTFIVSEEHLKKARQLEESGQHLGALAELSGALRFHKRELEFSQVAIRRAMGQILKKMPITPALPEEARRKVVEAEELIKKGGEINISMAESRYGDAVRSAPYVPSLHYNWATVKMMTIDFDKKKDVNRIYIKEVIEALEAYLDLAPDAPDARAVKDQVYRLELMRKE